MVPARQGSGLSAVVRLGIQGHTLKFLVLAKARVEFLVLAKARVVRFKYASDVTLPKPHILHWHFLRVQEDRQTCRRYSRDYAG